jgi:hydrogenase assembly chaperone HypC/HupF
MCVTYPGRVIDVSTDTATVDLDHRTRRASTVLTPDVAIGDWVIVAAGTILEILDPAEADEIITLLDSATSKED